MNAHGASLILKLQGEKVSSGKHLKEEDVYLKVEESCIQGFKTLPLSLLKQQNTNTVIIHNLIYYRNTSYFHYFIVAYLFHMRLNLATVGLWSDF